jgi:hypothetical protein
MKTKKGLRLKELEKNVRLKLLLEDAELDKAILKNCRGRLLGPMRYRETVFAVIDRH